MRPATGRWDDFASFMVPRKPGGRGCVCMAYRNSSLDMPGRIAHMRALCESEPGPGVLAYVDDEVAGWCSVAPKSTYRALVNSRTIPHLADEGAWSVVCFVVRPGFRRRGLRHQLLDGAVGHAHAMGAVVLEVTRSTLAASASTRPAVTWAPSSSSRPTASAASARPPAGAAASPAGSSAASFDKHPLR